MGNSFNPVKPGQRIGLDSFNRDREILDDDTSRKIGVALLKEDSLVPHRSAHVYKQDSGTVRLLAVLMREIECVEEDRKSVAVELHPGYE